MNDLERFNATMNYGNPDRAPFKEFLWPTWRLIPVHIDTGVDILSPFEVQAGMGVLVRNEVPLPRGAGKPLSAKLLRVILSLTTIPNFNKLPLCGTC